MLTKIRLLNFSRPCKTILVVQRTCRSFQPFNKLPQITKISNKTGIYIGSEFKQLKSKSTITPGNMLYSNYFYYTNILKESVKSLRWLVYDVNFKRFKNKWPITYVHYMIFFIMSFQLIKKKLTIVCKNYNIYLNYYCNIPEKVYSLCILNKIILTILAVTIII